MSKLGGLELNPALGGLEIINQPATSVPQDLGANTSESPVDNHQIQLLLCLTALSQ